MNKALTGLQYVASVFESFIVNGIAGADEHSDSEKSSSSEDQMDFPDDVDEATLTRSERIKLKNQR
jgi:hypothetical protein